ncbi:uncharacterized protein LOC123703258 [Colias croceus]|uniref:uncharacterized protein LOC123703258 n=1 Tax=Colias crocea TaxID=72248 RepID=UPI001E27FC1E|nr:uncharacterized protein LOC123703258 [Colias croceus]
MYTLSLGVVDFATEKRHKTPKLKSICMLKSNFVNGCSFGKPQIKKQRRSKPFEILYQNVRGLRTKLQDFYISVSSILVDLFAITETGCSESISDAELVPPGYSIIRCDRMDGRKQGGACLVAAPRFELRSVPVPCDINIAARAFELVCATVYLKKRYLFTVCVVYIPPNSNECEYMLLFKTIEGYYNKYSDLLVIGDFNLYSCSLNVLNYYEYFFSYCGFTQCNKVSNINNRQLDLVLGALSEGSLVSVCEASEPLVTVDAYHPPLLVSAWPRSPPAAAPYSDTDMDTRSAGAGLRCCWCRPLAPTC